MVPIDQWLFVAASRPLFCVGIPLAFKVTLFKHACTSQRRTFTLMHPSLYPHPQYEGMKQGIRAGRRGDVESVLYYECKFGTPFC